VLPDEGGWISGPSLDLPLTGDALRRTFPLWQIGRTPGGVWTAERTDGTAMRFLAADTSRELIDKIVAAESDYAVINSGDESSPPADVDDDVECEPNNLGFCRWCGWDMTP
jgi:hypothetical protein